MNFQRILVAILGVVLIAAAWRGYGWPGVALVAGGILMWVLLHFNRMMTALKRAADGPIGYVDSAVMLNAKLRTGLPMIQVVTLTKSLGRRVAERPETWGWADGSGSEVRIVFDKGRSQSWSLLRPAT